MGRQIKRQSVEVSYLVSCPELFKRGWLFGPEPNQTGLDRGPASYSTHSRGWHTQRMLAHSHESVTCRASETVSVLSKSDVIRYYWVWLGRAEGPEKSFLELCFDQGTHL